MPRKTNLSDKPSVGIMIISKLNKMKKSQKWLADELGLTYCHLSKIINGKCKPTVPTIKLIAECINLNAKKILLAVYDADLR